VPQANAVLARFCADYNQRFARPAAESARDVRSLPRRFDLARCLTLPINASSPTITPSPWARTASPSRRPASSRPALPPQKHAQRRPKLLTSAQKRKTTLPRIYNLSGRPALAVLT
jgi:hypothetical protein